MAAAPRLDFIAFVLVYGCDLSTLAEVIISGDLLINIMFRVNVSTCEIWDILMSGGWTSKTTSLPLLCWIKEWGVAFLCQHIFFPSSYGLFIYHFSPSASFFHLQSFSHPNPTFSSKPISKFMFFIKPLMTKLHRSLCLIFVVLLQPWCIQFIPARFPCLPDCLLVSQKYLLTPQVKTDFPASRSSAVIPSTVLGPKYFWNESLHAEDGEKI